MAKVVKFFALIAGTIGVLLLCRATHSLVFDSRQILSIGIFSMFIYGTLLFGDFRLAFAFGGIALLMICNLLTVERFTQAASLDVLIFLIGTFLVIGFLEESQFFEHIVSGIVAAIGPRPQRLLLILMIIASLASALVGEVTAILFMAGAMLHLTGRYKLEPAPFIIMLVFSCNVGSAMSSVGNPIGVLIALKTGLTFMDFLKWSAPVALLVDVATFAVCRWWFADAFAAFAAGVQEEFAARMARTKVRSRKAVAVGAAVGGGGPDYGESESEAEQSFEGNGQANNLLDPTYYSKESHSASIDPEARKAFRLCWVILLSLIALLVTHGITEKLLHLREGTMMVAAALVMGCIVLMLRREKARELVERRVDWWTLAFFMMLFASVGTLQDTHVTGVIAAKIKSLGGGQFATVQLIGWTTGWLSAFLDNVLAVATFMPVVHDIRMQAGAPYSSSIYWFMLFGGTFMGNMTIIGSTANIVAVGLLERRGHGTIRFGYWMKIGFLVSIVSMLVATGALTALDKLSPHGIPKLAAPTVESVAHE